MRELAPDGFPLLCVAGARQLRELGRGAGEVRGEQKRAARAAVQGRSTVSSIVGSTVGPRKGGGPACPGAEPGGGWVQSEGQGAEAVRVLVGE